MKHEKAKKYNSMLDSICTPTRLWNIAARDPINTELNYPRIYRTMFARSNRNN